MKWFIDTEFDEAPDSLIFLSIGLVSESGRELHMVSGEFDFRLCNEWVKQNVLPKIAHERRFWHSEIRDSIMEIVSDGGEPPTFYGWYSAYDWVLFCRLFGGMLNLPKGWPQICIDLRQELERYPALLKSREGFPPKPANVHNAVEDAKWAADVYRWLEGKRDLGHWVK